MMKLSTVIMVLLIFSVAGFADLGDRLDTVMAVAGPALNGASLVVMHDGIELYNESVGNQTSTQPRPVGSVSKWVTAAAIMTLVDDGLLDLNDTVGDILPQFTGTAADIELWMLLSNTSGYSDQPDYVYSDDLTLAEVVDSIAVSLEPEFDPGSSFYYADHPFSIAGRMAEVVTGQSWITICEERIADPLDITIYWSSQINPAPAGRLIISAESMIRFLEMIRNQGVYYETQVLSSEAVDLLLASYTDGVEIVYYPEIPIYDAFTYGLGHWNFTDAMGEATIHETASPGIFGCLPWIQDDLNLSCCFMAVDLLSNAIDYIDEIRIILNDELGTTFVTEKTPAQQPLAFTLDTYPNPFNNSLRIGLAGLSGAGAEISIYDLLGRRVAYFPAGMQSNESGLLSWQPENQASGVYLVAASTHNRQVTRKVVYLR